MANDKLAIITPRLDTYKGTIRVNCLNPKKCVHVRDLNSIRGLQTQFHVTTYDSKYIKDLDRIIKYLEQRGSLENHMLIPF